MKIELPPTLNVTTVDETVFASWTSEPTEYRTRFTLWWGDWQITDWVVTDPYYSDAEEGFVNEQVAKRLKELWKINE